MSYPEPSQQERDEQGVVAQRLDKYLSWITDEGASEISASFVLHLEDDPFLRIRFATFAAQLSYLHDEEEENDQYGVISVVTEIAISPYNPAWALTVCDTFNAHSLGGFAYTSPDDKAIYYRMILQDGDDAEEAANFLYFLERYQTYFYVLNELCRNEEQEIADESI